MSDVAPASPSGNAAEIPRRLFWRYLLICTLGPPLFVLIPYALAQAFSPGFRPTGGEAGYAFSLICGVPLFQALAFGVCCGRYRVGGLYALAGMLILAADLLFAVVVLREGAICVIMAMPILIVVVALAMTAGHWLGRTVGSPVLRSSLVPLALLAVSYDIGSGPPIYATSVADTMTINAPPEYVWPYLLTYPENDTPADYWLWKIGLPLPTRSVATAAQIGAVRECRFSKGVVLKEKITELVPNKVVTFDVTQQPDDPEILGHLTLDKGQLYLEPNPDGSTTVIATTWYRLFVSPAPYFDWWATDIGRNVHRRVLTQVKRFAEADWQRDHPNAN